MSRKALFRLASFAVRRGNEVKVIEELDKHLVDSAAIAYTMLRLRSYRLSKIAAIASLLHDVGKCLPVYQECRIACRDGTCSYKGHEVFSTIISEAVLDKLEILDNDEKLIVLYAIFMHHQAMGSPLERVRSFIIEDLRLRLSSASNLLKGIEKHLIILANGLKKLIRNLPKPLKEILEALPEALSGLDHRSLEEPLNALIEGKYAPQPRTTELYVKARLIAGTVMVADVYTAGLNRGGVPRHEQAIKAYRALIGYLNTSRAP